MEEKPVDRKEYLQQIRARFRESEKDLMPDAYPAEPNRQTLCEDESIYKPVHHSYWKVRLFLALVLFLGFVALRQTDTRWHDLSKDIIVQQIETDTQWKKFTGQLRKLENASIQSNLVMVSY